MEEYFFSTQSLNVGYHGKTLISDININIKKGEILTLIGPNGSGKSTILKSITKHLAMISGVVYMDKINLQMLSTHETATKISVVMTERIKPEMMTCGEIVATGRYPYTNHFGTLTLHDRKIVAAALERVHATDLANHDFSEISDGQRQRIMLARAIAQEPKIIVLDEPTSFLDIKHKIELLDILREMSRQKGITVIMSLHEIDLAPKISDKVMCVKGDKILHFGTPNEIFTCDIINNLYDITNGSYNMIFGSVELSKPQGKPKVFVIGGNGCGTPIYRELQKQNIAFSTGILFENDVDYHVASSLASQVYSTQAFSPILPEVYKEALYTAEKIGAIIDLGIQMGEFGVANSKILCIAKEKKIPIFHNVAEVVNYLNENETNPSCYDSRNQ